MLQYSRVDRPLSGVQVGLAYTRLVAFLGGEASDYVVEWGGDIPDLFSISTHLAVNEAHLKRFIDAMLILPLQADQPSILINEVATFDCTSSRLAADSDVVYFVYQGEALVASGSKAITGESMDSLTFQTDTPGLYTIEIRRQARPDGVDPETGQIIDNSGIPLETGQASLEVTEV